jgi:hypothetical protein
MGFILFYFVKELQYITGTRSLAQNLLILSRWNGMKSPGSCNENQASQVLLLRS